MTSHRHASHSPALTEMEGAAVHGCQSPMRIAVVVSTIGRAEGIDSLLRSLDSQAHRPASVVVVDQSAGEAVGDVVVRWASELPVRRVSSERGLSRGRNAGIAAVPDATDLIMFVDDDCVLEPAVLGSVVKHMSERNWDGISARLSSSLGVRVGFGAKSVVLDRRSVWTHAIEPGLTFRKQSLDTLGGFDPDLGIGSAGPWQSGEGTDLLLRGIGLGMTFVFCPDVVIREEAGTIGVDDLRVKSRRYARGTGRVYARYYSVISRLWVVVRPLAASALRRLQGRSDDSDRLLQVSIGRLEGVLGIVF